MSNTQFFSPKLVVTPQDKEANRLRILVPRPLEFWELFVLKTDETGEPVRRDDGTFAVTPYRKLSKDGAIDLKEIKSANSEDRPKLVVSYICWNYSLKCLQIFSFHQATLKDAIAGVVGEARLDGKTLCDFDITVIKGGDGSKMNTKYSVEVDRQKGKIVYSEVEPEVLDFYASCKNSGLIKGMNLLRNEYPFEGEAAEPMPTDMKRIAGLLTDGNGATVAMLISENDADAAAMIFRALVKKCDEKGYITESDEEGIERSYSIDDLKSFRNEKICPF